jgi:hypothetical protein
MLTSFELASILTEILKGNSTFLLSGRKQFGYTDGQINISAGGYVLTPDNNTFPLK